MRLIKSSSICVGAVRVEGSVESRNGESGGVVKLRRLQWEDAKVPAIGRREERASVQRASHDRRLMLKVDGGLCKRAVKMIKTFSFLL